MTVAFAFQKGKVVLVENESSYSSCRITPVLPSTERGDAPAARRCSLLEFRGNMLSSIANLTLLNEDFRFLRLASLLPLRDESRDPPCLYLPAFMLLYVSRSVINPFTENIFYSRSGSLFLISSNSCNSVYLASSIILFYTFSGMLSSQSVRMRITLSPSNLRITASSQV